MNPKDWSPGSTIAVKVNAKNDMNGNPRRGWMILQCRNGKMIDFVDEGYKGHSNLTSRYPGASEGPQIAILPKEYRELKKEFKLKSGLGCGPCERSKVMAKKSVPPVLMAWVTCRKASGVKPGVKMSAKQKSEARACVMREMRRKMAGKK